MMNQDLQKKDMSLGSDRATFEKDFNKDTLLLKDQDLKKDLKFESNLAGGSLAKEADWSKKTEFKEGKLLLEEKKELPIKLTSESKPIIDTTENKTIVITHQEPTVINRTEGKTEVKEHYQAPIVQQHNVAPIIKQEIQNVIHEHHKDVITEKHRDVIHEHHQPIVHEFHQPVIHEKIIHEIHQPIIHKKEQEVIHEKKKDIVHEKREGFVEEQFKGATKEEHFRKPIVETTEFKAPIIEKQTLEKEHFVQDKGLSKVVEVQKDVGLVKEGDLDLEVKEKKGLGTKLKEFFTGKPEEQHEPGAHTA